MTTKTKTYSIIGVSVAVVAAVSLAVVLLGDRSVSNALALQSQLTSENPPPPNIQKRLAQDLARAVDKMNREQLRELNDEVREQTRAVFAQNLDEYLQAPVAERDAMLDRHLDELKGWQQVHQALRTDAFRTRGGRRRGGNPQDRQAGRNAARGADRNGAQGRRRERSAQPGRDGGRQPAEGDRTNRDLQRAQYAEYWQALSKRAEENGIDFGRGFGRPGRRGRTG